MVQYLVMNNKIQIADTHAHIYFPVLDKKRDEVIARAKNAGVELQIQVGCDEISSLAALRLADQYEGYYSSIGLHPCDVNMLGKPTVHRISGLENYKLRAHTQDQFFKWAEELFLQNQKKVVAFGETGFDFYHNDTPELRVQQESSFLNHVKLAKKYDKTLIIHTRSARQEMLDFLKKYKKELPKRAVIHCFAEDKNFALEVTQQYGFYLGIGGIATYPKAAEIREAIKVVPLEFLITETDAPFLPPQKARTKHKTNEPAFLMEVVEIIADVKEEGVERVAEVLFENAKRCFQI